MRPPRRCLRDDKGYKDDGGCSPAEERRGESGRDSERQTVLNENTCTDSRRTNIKTVPYMILSAKKNPPTRRTRCFFHALLTQVGKAPGTCKEFPQDSFPVPVEVPLAREMAEKTNKHAQARGNHTFLFRKELYHATLHSEDWSSHFKACSTCPDQSSNCPSTKR